jgi:hypothetical protein
MKFLTFIARLLIDGEPDVERILQPEDPSLARKRSDAKAYLRTESRKWRDRRNQNALKDPSGANEGSAS